ncbi:MAG: hypothetical protein IJO76_05800 [Clostridia bacterium]|nr:hypothetical protein [Clostridia bacterium]
MEKQFVIGAARRVITPPLGTPLCGYPYERAATSVNDDLKANVIALGYGEATALWISLDVISVDNVLRDDICALAEQHLGIGKDHIIVCAIHTHSGPAVSAIWGGRNEAYVQEILLPMTLEAMKEAVTRTQPAVMGVATTTSQAGINRREFTKDGNVILGQNPFGMYDPEMTVLAFQSLDGKPLLNVVHYGAHATAAGEGPVITRDWPGFMVDSMEKNTSAMTVFMNGAEGDVGPRCSNGKTTGGKPDGDIMMACEVGSVAVIDAMQAYRHIKAYKPVDFRVAAENVKLPRRPLPPLAELIRERDSMGDPAGLIETNAARYAYLQRQIEMVQSGASQEDVVTLRQVFFALNDVAVAPFPFEMFSEITLRLKQHSPCPYTLALSNANGKEGYLPSQDQLCRGGYEVEMFLTLDTRLAENTDTNIVSEYLRVLEKL